MKERPALCVLNAGNLVTLRVSNYDRQEESMNDKTYCFLMNAVWMICCCVMTILGYLNNKSGLTEAGAIGTIIFLIFGGWKP